MKYQVSQIINWYEELSDVPERHQPLFRKLRMEYLEQQARASVSKFVAGLTTVTASKVNQHNQQHLTSTFFFLDAERWKKMKEELVHATPKGQRRSLIYELLDQIENKLTETTTNG